MCNLVFSKWDILSCPQPTCHMIVNFFWLISLFATDWLYLLSTVTQSCCVYDSRLQNSNAACRVSFRAILIEHIVRESGFRFAIMYFLSDLGSILRLGSAIAPSNNICTSVCMLAFVNTHGMSVLAMYHPFLALLAQDDIIASSGMLGDLISVLVV